MCFWIELAWNRTYLDMEAKVLSACGLSLSQTYPKRDSDIDLSGKTDPS